MSATQKDIETRMARALRFITVRGYYQAGEITEAEAIEILGGCLTPGDETTRVDDSALLGMSNDAAADALGLTSGPTEVEG